MLGNALLKGGQRLPALLFEADADEHVQPQAQRRRTGQRHIALNDPRRLQRLDPHEAGRRRQVHPARQGHIGQRTVGLKLSQNPQIDHIQIYILHI